MYSPCLLHDLEKEFVTINSSKPTPIPSAEEATFIPGLACGVWSTSPESTAGGGSWERQKFQDWEERRGFAHLQPARHKTDLSSQPWNSSSGAHVIKSWTNCESPLKKIKSSVPPAPTHGRVFLMSSSAGRDGSPAPSPSPRAGPRFFVAGGSLAPPLRLQSCRLPCSQGRAGKAGRGGKKVGGTRLSKASSTSRTDPPPAMRAPA